MKKNLLRTISIYSCCLILLTAPSACNDSYFDTQPDNLVTLDDIFSNRGQTERWLAGLYSLVPDIWNADQFVYVYTNTTDEMDVSNWNNPAINSGALSPSTTPSRWNQYYEKIRLASIFLERIDGNQEIQGLVNGAQLIKQYRGEARFLRAYYYWLIMKDVGPAVIMPLTPGTPEDDFQIPRSSWDECVDFVLSELALAKEDLPLNNYVIGSDTELDATQTGRINQIIATAVESQILLFHASPLYNGNTEMSDFRNLDGKQLISQTADPSRWERAATAAKAAIDIAEANGKSLFRVENEDPFRAAFLSCRNLFWDGWKAEGIWLRTANDISGWERRVAPRSVQGTGYNGLAVVQRLVDDFRMVDGSDIHNTELDYREDRYVDEATPYYVAGTNTMYTQREPRFYVNITFNGAVNPGVAKSGDNNSRVEFFNTGTSGKAGAPRDWPTTGYVARKNIHPTYSASPAVNVARPTMVIRLGELYLNYAEALNEATPGHPDILKYLNAIRERGGLKPLLPGMSQTELREQIRLERRIELAFEGHRYFDVRRWKLANQPGYQQGGAFYGMDMNAGTSLSSPEFHRRTLAFTRAPWQRRYYFLPYGQNEMDRNKQLVNVQGY